MTLVWPVIADLVTGSCVPRQRCPYDCNDGQIERRATPDEVDEGCEFGIAFDPCPNCAAEELGAADAQTYVSEL